MKANELMIGDWVKTTSDWPERYQNKITRVRGLCDENGQIDCDLTEPNGAYVWSDDEDSFEPIPLTAEILEKNGFKEKGAFYRFGIFDYGLYISEITESVWKFQFYNHECPAFDSFICVGYVHELQHALRLCGIEKSIEI